MSNPSELWFALAAELLSSNTTRVIAVETRDPVRHGELQSYILADGTTDDAANQWREVYAFHPWGGLQRRSYSGRGASQRVDVSAVMEGGGSYDPTGQQPIRDLTVALRHMDTLLRTQSVALVLEGLESFSDTESVRTLSMALSAWAMDRDLIDMRSAVFVITTSLEDIMVEGARHVIGLVRPSISNPEERTQLVEHYVSQLPALSRLGRDRNMIQNLVRATSGLNLHQVSTTLLRAYALESKLELSTVKAIKSEYMRHSRVLEIEEPALSFDDIGGYADLKAYVRRNICDVIADPARTELTTHSMPRGLLMYGPPGTGKTMFAKALARETNLPLINLKTENLVSSWLGETGRRLKDALDLAEANAPAFIFIDEVDRFGARPGNSDSASGEMSRVFSQLLEYLGDERRQTIIIGTTNKPEVLDDAFVRPGRFSVIVPFLYPDQDARLQILELLLGIRPGIRRPCPIDATVRPALESIARQSVNFAGADLEEIVLRAKETFFHDRRSHQMSGGHLLSGFRSYAIDTESRQRLLDRYRQLGPRFTTLLTRG